MTLEKINVKRLEPIFEKFDKNIFNKLSYNERLDQIKALSEAICEQLGVDMQGCDFKFLSGKYLKDEAARYYHETNVIMLNEDIISQEAVNDFHIFCILDSTIHETTHYIQDKLDLFPNSLYDSLQTIPYYIF